MNDRPTKLKLTHEDLAAIKAYFVREPRESLLSEAIRRHIAISRWERRGKHLDIFRSEGAGIMPGTIEHNRKELDEALFGSNKRTMRLLNPLSAIDPIYGDAPNVRLLSIGPRTEMELLHLIGLGFNINNIRAVDLISCSPWIDLGDMHCLPYPDRCFEVVLSSWVLNYSKHPQLAVDEMCRVCMSGGLIAIGVTYDPAYGRDYVARAPGEREIVGSMQRSVSDLTALLGDRLDQVYFQSEPRNDEEKAAVMLIARIKH